MDDIVNDFLIESHEGLDQLDRDLITLEHASNDKELLARIFRCVHTIKGTCGFLAFSKLESVSHVGENLLVKLRDGALSNSPELTSALLALVDAIREMLASIESAGSEGDGDYTALIARLVKLHDGEPQAAPASVKATPSPVSDEPTVPQAPTRTSKPRKRRAKASDALGEILVQSGKAERADVLAALQEQHGGNQRPIGEILVDRGGAPAAGVAEALESQAESRSHVSDSSIRVDVALLDKLMNLVGELVLARNQILQHASASQGTSLQAPAQRLDLLTTELQEGVMKTRMQPIGNYVEQISSYRARCRQLACGNKQMRIEMEGR